MSELLQRVGRQHLEELQARRAVATIPEDGGAVLTLPPSSAGVFCEAMAKIQETGREFDGYFQDGHISRLRVTKPKGTPKSARPFCGARTRAGTPCKARVCQKPGGKLSTRCKLHGGKSTGPRTPEGRARIAESNRARAQARREAQAAST